MPHRGRRPPPTISARASFAADADVAADAVFWGPNRPCDDGERHRATDGTVQQLGMVQQNAMGSGDSVNLVSRGFG